VTQRFVEREVRRREIAAAVFSSMPVVKREFVEEAGPGPKKAYGQKKLSAGGPRRFGRARSFGR